MDATDNLYILLQVTIYIYISYISIYLSNSNSNNNTINNNTFKGQENIPALLACRRAAHAHDLTDLLRAAERVLL